MTPSPAEGAQPAPSGTAPASEVGQIQAELSRCLWFGGILALFWAVAIFGRPVIAKAVALYPLGQAAHPYFQPAHAVLLYLATPIVVLCGFVLLFSPAALLLLALDEAGGWCEFLLKTFASMVLLLVVVTSLMKATFFRPLTPGAFIGSLVVLSVIFWVGLLFRLRRGLRVAWPWSARSDRRRMLQMGAVVVLGVILLLPKLFWESFSGDGFELWRLASSLSRFQLPVWVFPNHLEPEDVKSSLPMYLVNWMVGLFGQAEPSRATLRIPPRSLAQEPVSPYVAPPCRQ